MNKEDLLINFSKINQLKIKNLLQEEQLFDKQDFNQLRPTCYMPATVHEYHKHYRNYHVNKNVETVWEIYKTIAPAETWCGPMVTFGCQYDRINQEFSYLNDKFGGLKAGQILFLNLRLPGGLLNIAVCHEIMEVNDALKLIKICYLEKGASEGTQLIQLFQTEEGFTKIDHTTYYRSNSLFRDKVLYPTLHAMAIAEFHYHIRTKIESL